MIKNIKIKTVIGYVILINIIPVFLMVLALLNNGAILLSYLTGLGLVLTTAIIYGLIELGIKLIF